MDDKLNLTEVYMKKKKNSNSNRNTSIFGFDDLLSPSATVGPSGSSSSDSAAELYKKQLNNEIHQWESIIQNSAPPPPADQHKTTDQETEPFDSLSAAHRMYLDNAPKFDEEKNSLFIEKSTHYLCKIAEISEAESNFQKECANMLKKSTMKAAATYGCHDF